MHKIAVVMAFLACLARGSQGRRVKNFFEPSQSRSSAEVQNVLTSVDTVSTLQPLAGVNVSCRVPQLRSLATLLMAGSPASAFMPCVSQDFGFSMQSPTLASWRGVALDKPSCFGHPDFARSPRSTPCIHMSVDFGKPIQDTNSPFFDPATFAPTAPETDPPTDAPTVPPLRVLTAPMPSIDSRLAEADRLIKWIEDYGGYVGVIPEGDADGAGIGLFAAKEARRGEVVLSVPLELGISAESCLRSSIGEYLAEFYPYLADYAFIALALIHERRLGPQSDLEPWVSGSPSLLPASGFADLPLLWGADALADVDAATTAGAVDRMESVRSDYEWLEANVFSYEPGLFPKSEFNLDTFTQAVSLAFSRSVAVESGDDVSPVLLPLIDLANHDMDPTATVQAKAGEGPGLFGTGLFGGDATPDCVTLVSRGRLAEGASVDVAYGGQTSGELFLDYGFLQEPVPYVASASFAIDENDRFFDEKVGALEEGGMPDESTWLIAEADDENPEALPEELIAFLRLKHMTGDDVFLLEPVFRGSLWNQHLFLPVSPRNERAALNDLKEYVDASLEQLGGSAKEDLAVMKQKDKDSRAYKLASLRYAERRALQSASRAIGRQAGDVKSLQFYSERRLAFLGLDPIENEDELAALKARAAGRGVNEYQW